MFGKGLGKGVGPVDWTLLGVGALATIVLGVIVTHNTKAKFAESKRQPVT